LLDAVQDLEEDITVMLPTLTMEMAVIMEKGHMTHTMTGRTILITPEKEIMMGAPIEKYTGTLRTLIRRSMRN